MSFTISSQSPSPIRDDIRELQDTLTATQFACVPPDVRSTNDDIYPAVRREYPELCDDDWTSMHGQRHGQWERDSDPLRVPDHYQATFRTIQAYLADTAVAVDDELAQEVSLLDTLIQHHEPEPTHTLSGQALDRLSDLVELAPTTNGDLADAWDVKTGAEVHAYLESELDGYYRRDDNRMLRPTAEVRQVVATRS